MTEISRGIYFPVVRQQFLDATNPEPSTQFGTDHLKAIARVVEGTVLAEAFPERLEILRGLANPALAATIQVACELEASGSQVAS